MKSLLLFLLTSFLIFSFIVSGYCQVLDGSNQVPGQYLIQFNSQTNLNKFHNKLASDRSYIQSKSLGKNSSIVSIYAPDLTYENLKEMVSNLDGVVAFQKDYYLEERFTIPNDPLFSNNQWDMNIIKAPEAWDYATGGKTPLGHDIVVAILDGGFYIDHPDLVDNLFTNTAEIPDNGIDDDNNGYIDDVHGVNLETKNGTHSNAIHGAGVMGIIGARGNNGIGMSGVNWNVRMMPISKALAVSALIEGYEYIKDFRKKFNQSHGQEGAFIVASNLSAGLIKKFPIDQPIWCNMYDSLGMVGILSTGATANANTDVDAEGDLPSTCESEFLIVVTNTTQNDVKYGSAGYGSKSVDLGAPGDGSTSTYDPIGYANFGGASCATPHVTGAIALMYAASTCSLENSYMDYPVESARAVRNAILNNVDILPSLVGKTLTGGRLNLFKMITKCVASTSSHNKIQFSIYPNPVAESLTIELGTIINDNILVQIIDMQGRVVDQSRYPTLDERVVLPVNSISSGIYCVKVLSGKYAGSAKFIKL